MSNKYTRSVAVNMVIANMIGTGIFTSLGFQVMDSGIPDTFSILVIWILGGLIALCGATAYGEVASTIRKSGGEYTFLSELYHPAIGFASGWISLIVGFSAAIATLGLATGEYFLPLTGLEGEAVVTIFSIAIPIKKVIALSVIAIVVIIQLRGVKVGGMFQNIMTYVKLGMIVFFLITPFIFSGSFETSEVSFAPSDSSSSTIFSLSFAGALVWVMFAYSGWNASSYIAGNLEDPKRNLPYSLLVGTLIVTVLYVLLNMVFLYVADFSELAGQVDVGNIVANKMMGEEIGLIFSAVFSIALISGINAMFIAGPRVGERMGKDYAQLNFLGKETPNGAPVYSILLLFVIASSLVVFSSFKDIIEYIAVTLSLFSLLVVGGVFILRKRKVDQEGVVRTWGYPVTPIIFIFFTCWMVYYFVSEDIWTLVYSLLTILSGVIIYLFLKRNED